jgi:hypothetical protein
MAFNKPNHLPLYIAIRTFIINYKTKHNTMKALLITPENTKEFNFFNELLTKLNAKLSIVDNSEVEKLTIIDNITQGLHEVNLFKKGKLKTTLAKDFLNEL